MVTPAIDIKDEATLDGDSGSHEEKGFRSPEFLALGEEAQPIDPEMEKRVLRKIDRFLMPAMLIGMFLTLLL